jgi:hypothetical protein
MSLSPNSPASSGPDPAELAELEALAGQLNRLGFPSLLLTPPGKLPYVDTGLPQGMTAGEQIFNQAGTFFWPDAHPIGPSDQPVAAAEAIARVLVPGIEFASSAPAAEGGGGQEC